MIDLLSNETFTTDQLKARAMARLAESGLGLAERLANVERVVYSLLDPSGHALSDPVQVAGIGAALAVAEGDYVQEANDNALLIATLKHEAAVDRLARPALLVADYPKVDYIDPLTGKPTGTKIDAPEIVADKAERKAAQATVKIVSAPVKALVAKRLKARKAAATA